MEDNIALRTFKNLLTRVGAGLSWNALLNLQAVINYLKVGHWMRQRQFEFPDRVQSREEVWSAIVPRLQTGRVLYLEFGVAEGASIRWWSSQLKNPQACLHGFDSFEGLGEEAGPWTKGQFGTQGKTPKIDDPRVQFFKGWFDQVLPTYSVPPHDILVLNMDADLYSSTIYVLRQLRPYIKPGTFIYFDEMNHVDHEPKAFDEFVAEAGLCFKPIRADVTLAYVMFECLGVTTDNRRPAVPAPASNSTAS